MTRKPLDDRTLSILAVLCIVFVAAAIVGGFVSSRDRVAKTQQPFPAEQSDAR